MKIKDLEELRNLVLLISSDRDEFANERKEGVKKILGIIEDIKITFDKKYTPNFRTMTDELIELSKFLHHSVSLSFIQMKNKLLSNMTKFTILNQREVKHVKSFTEN